MKMIVGFNMKANINILILELVLTIYLYNEL